MIVTPLASRSTRSLRDALLAHGWDAATAADTAGGMETATFHCRPLGEEALPALVRTAGRLGLEVVTGADWAVISGARSRLSSFARPWTLPPELAELSLAVAAALPAELPSTWQTAAGPLPLERGVLIGVLAAQGEDPAALDALRREAERHLAGGAEVLDVSAGGRRPRRGATVSSATERAWMVAAVTVLRASWPGVALAAHTAESTVAAAALDAGAAIVNDPSGLAHDPAMAPLAAARGAGVIVLPASSPEGSAEPPGDAGTVVGEVLAALRRSLAIADRGGVSPDRIVVDPGFGLGRPAAANWALLRGLGGLRALGRPLCAGLSRKRFLGSFGESPGPEADPAAAAAGVLAWERGARLFRVHDAAVHREALRVASATGDA